MVSDVSRNELIARKAADAVATNRFPLLISDRKEHLDVLAVIINDTVKTKDFEVVRMDGDLSTKQRRSALSRLHELRSEGKRTLLMATASLIGEGFDLPELDTLILATPLSFEGRMIQYAGRIHRRANGKTDVQMIDFVDSFNAMLLKMYRNRIKAYRQMGYEISQPAKVKSPLEQYVVAKQLRAE